MKDVGVDGIIFLKLMWGLGGMVWTEFIWLTTGLVTGSCEDCDKHLGFMKGGEFLDLLSDSLTSVESLCTMDFICLDSWLLSCNLFLCG